MILLDGLVTLYHSMPMISERTVLFYQTGFTRTDLALTKIKDELFTASSGSRQGAKKIVILATDGKTLGRPF